MSNLQSRSGVVLSFTAALFMGASAILLVPQVQAADQLTVGVLIPGSKSDKGWMESGYDGLMAAEQTHEGEIKVQMIENISYADMEQALTNLASRNELVIGIGGQTQAAVFKVAKRFPNTHFSIVGGNAGTEAPNVAGYDVKQAEIAYVAGAAAAMLSKTGGVSYVGGMELPSIVKEQGTHIVGSYTNRCGSDPLYVGYSITGVGYQVQYAIDQAVAGTWVPGYKAFGLNMGPEAADMQVCNATPEMEDKLEQIMQDIKDGKISVLEG